MADTHLWRHYDTAPHWRYACTLAPADTVDRFVVTDRDGRVADLDFLERVARVLTSPVPRRSEGRSLAVEFVSPGDPGHFTAAVRQIPKAMVSAVGRS